VAPELARSLLSLVVMKTSIAAAARPCIADDAWLAGVMGGAAEAWAASTPAGPAGALVPAGGAQMGAGVEAALLAADDYASEPASDDGDEDAPSDQEVEAALQPRAVVVDEAIAAVGAAAAEEPAAAEVLER